MDCKCERIMSVSGKTSDCCGVSLGDKYCDGYVPYDIRIGGGDYLEFKFCVDCGKIQGKFPIPEEALEIVFPSGEDEEE